MNPSALVVPMLQVGAAGADGARQAAVLFQIAPGWHIYWENPGDTGLATAVGLSAPAGVAVGPARFPGPTRFDLPGGLTSAGYSDQAAVVFDLGPGAAAGTLQATASWLVCRDDLCIPGDAVLQASAAQQAVDLASAVALLPAPVPAAAVVRNGDSRVVTLAGASGVEVFPDLALEPHVLAVRVDSDPSGVRCTLELAPDAAGRAVLAVSDGANRRYLHFTVPESTP
jgi:DsbC/DsbD-like thiol-disulfide interchange protein